MSLQPFLISEFKTGLFNYLEPWIRPNEAFDPLSNSYIYRGSLNKRLGYSLFGLLTYCDSGIAIETGDGGTAYSGTLATFPIRAGSFEVITRDDTTAAIIETFTDNGAGVLTGSAGGSGTINYTTGAWALTFGGALAAGIVIYASYTFTPTQTTTPAAVFRPIMAIKQFQDDSNNTRLLVACDTRRAAVFNNTTGVFDPLCSVSEQIGVGDGTMGPFAFNAGFGNIAPDSFVLDGVTETFHDTGTGNLVGSAGGTGTINYTSGAFTVTFNANNSDLWTLTYTLTGDYFTGDSSNFFNSTNWKPTTTATAYLYLTNNVDPVTLFDGTNLSRPPFPITQADLDSYTNDILRTLDVKVYKNRLLMIRPTTRGNSTPDGQSIRWSAQFNPFNFVADISGFGGELSAPTDRWIFSAAFLRDQIAVGYQGGSTWLFRFTGNAFDPFRWDKINDSKSIDAPYAGVEYDERVTFAGANGLLACDGVNVQRYDLPIIDQFLDINQEFFEQCFAQRFDTLNQTWMLYPSASENAEISDKVLIYNFVENTWSTYDVAMSCLGIYFPINDATWDDFAVGQPLGTDYPDWESADVPWNYFLYQGAAPALLGGTHDGVVVLLNEGNQDKLDIPFDDPEDIVASITSTRWNPFMGMGQRTQFAYVDIYYKINPDCQLLLSFFPNNSSASAADRVVTLDGPINDDFAMKRVYINLNGEFVRMRILSDSRATFQISGMILWAQPAGRFTPGATV